MGVKKLNPDNFIIDDLEIIGIFKSFFQTKEKLWSWQQKFNAQGIRPVHFCMIRKIDVIKKFIEIVPNNSSGFKFTPGEEIFIFSRERGLAVKIKPREMEGPYLVIPLPTRLSKLAPDFVSKISLVEADNEEANLTNRAAPRKKAGEKMATIKKLGDAEGQVNFFDLYDISPGGMGFTVEDPAEFAKGETVQLIAIDGKALPKPVEGTITAVRQMDDEFGGDLFKVGVKFG